MFLFCVASAFAVLYGCVVGMLSGSAEKLLQGKTQRASIRTPEEKQRLLDAVFSACYTGEGNVGVKHSYDG